MALTTVKSYSIADNKWDKDEPPLPVGKVAPTLINVANRYIYHIAGVELTNSIYMYDTFIA